MDSLDKLKAIYETVCVPLHQSFLRHVFHRVAFIVGVFIPLNTCMSHPNMKMDFQHPKHAHYHTTVIDTCHTVSIHHDLNSAYD